MTVLEPEAEILKLAHQLGVPSSQLAFLTDIAPDELRTLRQQIGDALFNADKHHFGKVVAVSKVLPGALAAKITEHALPPLIAARTAELLEPARAVEMVGRLSDRYLADVSAAMDPARAPQLIAEIPAEQVRVVGDELARRGEWVVMGSFVSLVSLDALRAAVSTMTGEQLLRVGFVLDDLARLDDIAQMLTDSQLDDILTAAVANDLWRELDEMLTHLDDAHTERLAARYATADPSDIAAAEAAVAAGSLSPPSLAKLESA